MSIDPISLTDEIKQTYLRYLTSTFQLSNIELEDIFCKRLNSFDFFQGPFLETVSDFKLDKSLNDLVEEGILDPYFKDISIEAFPHIADKSLYKHQENALRKVTIGRNIVVATGTGSGKTETFLLPILNHLFHEYRKGELNPGVRALILYPMNALANDQIRRLRKISSAINRVLPDIGFTFGRFIGETRNSRNEAFDKFAQQNPGEEKAPGELLSREEMRKTPPHILITNYAMLEYLLLRPDDSPLFDGEYSGNWKFLILDEAHIYDGSAGIEIAMLLRRLKDRVVQSTSGRLQCIATSATLSNEPSEAQRVITFAQNLFGEPFEWSNEDPSKQDVVFSEIMPVVVTTEEKNYPLEIYGLLEKLIESEIEYEKIIEFLDKNNIHIDVTNNDINSLLYDILSKDRRLQKIKNFLEEKPYTFYNLLSEVMADTSPVAIEALKTLIRIAPKAKASIDSISLLSARYHFFVRAPEGVFMSFYPKTEVYLGRREKSDDDTIVFETASCRRCGQLYLVGIIDHDIGRLRQVTPEDLIKERKMYFMDITSQYSHEENEDEQIAVEESGVSQKDTRIKCCMRCGAISDVETDLPCDCIKELGIQHTLLQIRIKTDTLNECSACGLRSTNVVSTFILQKDAPSSVLATSLISSGVDEQNKLLVFSDSRQDAAFFAPYLEASYKRILFRRLIWMVISEVPESDYRLESLTKDVFRIGSKYELFDDHLGESQKLEECWRWIIQEYTGLWDRRNSLEGLGLIAFEPIPPGHWQPSLQVKKLLSSLSIDEIYNLYCVLLDTLRYNMVITFPKDAPLPHDIFYAPRNRNYYIRGSNSDRKKGILSWLPSANFGNSRSDFLRKLFPDVDTNSIKKILSVIWEDLVGSWINCGIQSCTIKGSGNAFKLDYRHWKIVRHKSNELYICNTCGTIHVYNVRSICSIYNCLGNLIPASDETFSRFRNHYRHLYNTLNPKRVTVHEHTAQLTPEYASQLQQEFIKGKTNVLSCSTTFELGVDLGDLETVFLKNVPPRTSNYVQRTGRAGRRSDSIGFALTFAQLRSHDLSHFKNPERMISGKVACPVISISNEKIIRRHIHSIVLAYYLRLYKDYYGKIDNFFHFDENFSQSDELLKFLSNHPRDLEESITRILPNNMITAFRPDSWGWVDQFVGDDGVLRIAETKLYDEYIHLTSLYNECEKQWINQKDHREKKKIQNLMNWYDKRLNTIKRIYLLEYLSSNVVIPKYGFPVDVVDLSVISNIHEANNIRLQRDLRIAISEFAPGSKLVANGYLWESTGLRVLKDRAWPIYSYAICDKCNSFNQFGEADEKTLSNDCSWCGEKLNKGNKHQFILPQFGFVSSSKPEKAGSYRPQKPFTSRPYMISVKNTEELNFKIGTIIGLSRYSNEGSLAVVSSGSNGLGYSVCRICGFASQNIRPPKTHQTFYNKECPGKLEGWFHLGHQFYTDVVVLELKIRTNVLPYEDFESFQFSMLYGLIEGICFTLSIRRQDIAGCLYHSLGNISFAIYDNVPGGAGHVKRLMDDTLLVEVFQNTLNIMESCTCGHETSCYSCLRNYENQFCHSKLKRGSVIDFLRNYMKS